MTTVKTGWNSRAAIQYSCDCHTGVVTVEDVRRAIPSGMAWPSAVDQGSSVKLFSEIRIPDCCTLVFEAETVVDVSKCTKQYAGTASATPTNSANIPHNTSLHVELNQRSG